MAESCPTITVCPEMLRVVGSKYSFGFWPKLKSYQCKSEIVSKQLLYFLFVPLRGPIRYHSKWTDRVTVSSGLSVLRPRLQPGLRS